MVKIFATVMLAAGAAASRNEGTTLLQTKGRMDELSVSLEWSGEQRNAQLLSMKEQVLAFAQAGVPGAAKTFLQQIDTMLREDVLAAILKEKTDTGTLESNDLQPFQAAVDAYTGTMGPLRAGGADSTAVSQAKTTHTDCRGLESIDHNESTTCNTEKGKKEGTLNRGVSALHTLQGTTGVCDTNGWHQTAVADLESYVADVKTVFDDRKALDTQTTTCNRLAGELETQKGTCDGNQGTYETLACTLAQGVENAAIEYKRAYKAANSTIQANWQTWQVQSDDRIKQCQLVNTIICYVGALEQNDDKAPLESAITQCDQENHDCDAYGFTASDLPAEISLDVVPAAPCEVGFEYGAFPEGTAQATCTPCTLKR